MVIIRQQLENAGESPDDLQEAFFLPLDVQRR